MRAASGATGLALAAAGGIATTRGSFGWGFLALVLGFSLLLAPFTQRPLGRYGGGLLAACLASILLMPIHAARRRGQTHAGPTLPSPSPGVVGGAGSALPPAISPRPGGGDRGGLTEEARRAIFHELRRAEARASLEATAAQPEGDSIAAPANPEKAMLRARRRQKLGQMLEAEYRRQIATRHDLSEEQLAAIFREGLARDWTAPAEGEPAPTPVATPRK